MISLTWEQVHAWRLEQQCLAREVGAAQLYQGG